MFLLGYDIGSSSIKVALVNGDTNQVIKQTQYPEVEMEIHSSQRGWAEQQPEDWWNYLIAATKKLLTHSAVDPQLIKAIGLSYQMHGLVLLDKNKKVLRPSIIWCDSRAVPQGERALELLGKEYCYGALGNAPGNFTASKLIWVKENEPEIYDRIDQIMLPGDYIAMKMTGTSLTTPTGLSEGIFWDFRTSSLSQKLLSDLEINRALFPTVVDSFSKQGYLSSKAATTLGLSTSTSVGYRAGDQPNNALSLGVLNPGQIAGTGGTSGVIYGVHDQLTADRSDRTNTFAHVNYTSQHPNVGVLLCINGAGSMYRWINQQIAGSAVDYSEMENALQKIPIGSEGISVFPFGNGAERLFGNRDLGAQIMGIQLNRHHRSHIYRAGLEGIAFSFYYGIEAMKEMGMPLQQMRVGNDNLFQSKVFSQTISNLIEGPIEMVQTTGAIGASRAAGYTVGQFSSLEEAFSGDPLVKKFEPDADLSLHQEAYKNWKNVLDNTLKNHTYE